jgi:SAM-dependent MidA family methyltransferase
VTLLDRLVTSIRSGGPIPFEEFQSIALYDEEGFFGSKLRSVKEGDFLTSPEVSPLFGETLAVFVDRVLDGLSVPSTGQVHASGSQRAERVVPSPSEQSECWGRCREVTEGVLGVAHGEVSRSDGGGLQAEPDIGGSPPEGGGGPSLPLLIEAGAGSGSLLRPLLGALHHSIDVWAVEVSPPARALLVDLLRPDRVVGSLEGLAATFSGVVIANELLDNLPVALAVRTGDGWEERWVGVEDGRLVLVPHEPRPEVEQWASRFGLPCPEGGRVEVQLSACEWVQAVLGRLVEGAVVLIDYGDTTEGLERRRADGTLRTYRGHHLGPQPLLEPGETDITVDVNFTAVMAIAEVAGAEVEMHRQDDFLESLGLRDRIAELRERELTAARSGDTMGQLQARSDRTNAETLLHPRGLGDFKVLVVRT